MACLAALVLCAYILLFPTECIFRAQSAMRLWATAVAPALFPFMALLPVLTSTTARKGYGRAFAFIMKPLFKLSGEAAASAVVGLLGGSPAGAMAIRRASRDSALSPRGAVTLCALSSGCSPVFLVCSVGAGMFIDSSVGFKLLLCMWLSQFILAFTVARLPLKMLFIKSGHIYEPFGAGNSSAINDAVAGTLSVCGWMILFSVFGGALPAEFCYITEVSAACAFAAESENAALAAFACGFGGVCAGCQNMAHLKNAGVNAIVYFAMKAICGSLCYTLFALSGVVVLSAVKTDMLTAGIMLSSFSAAVALCLALFYRGANTN